MFILSTEQFWGGTWYMLNQVHGSFALGAHNAVPICPLFMIERLRPPPYAYTIAA